MSWLQRLLLYYLSRTTGWWKQSFFCIVFSHGGSKAIQAAWYIGLPLMLYILDELGTELSSVLFFFCIVFGHGGSKAIQAAWCMALLLLYIY